MRRTRLVARKATAEEIARSDADLAAHGPTADKLLRDRVSAPVGEVAFRSAIRAAAAYRFCEANLQGGSGNIKALRGEADLESPFG